LAQANARIQRDIARGWLEVPPDDLHECRFARTVSANQAITVAFAELDTDVLEEGLGAELDGEVGSGDHLVWNSRKKWVKPFILPALVNGVRVAAGRPCRLRWQCRLRRRPVGWPSL